MIIASEPNGVGFTTVVIFNAVRIIFVNVDMEL